MNTKAIEERNTKTELGHIGEGLIERVVRSSADVASKTTRASFGAVREVQGELHRRALAALDFVDGAQQGVVKLGRRVNQTVDEIGVNGLETTESLLLQSIRVVAQLGLVGTRTLGAALGLLIGVEAVKAEIARSAEPTS